MIIVAALIVAVAIVLAADWISVAIYHVGSEIVDVVKHGEDEIIQDPTSSNALAFVWKSDLVKRR